MQITSITAPAHGRVLWLDRPEPAGHLLALHGYGQLAEAFATDIEPLAAQLNYSCCIPEARHHFYRRGGHGAIGASWMTSHARDEALADVAAYLDTVVTTCRQRWSCTRLVGLGFSQGTAQLWRLAHRQPSIIRSCIAVAGDLPEDLIAHPWPKPPDAYLVAGETDQIYTAKRCATDQDRMQRCGMRATVLHHPGGHVIDDGVRSLIHAACS